MKIKKEVGILFYTTPESLKGQIYNVADLTNFTKEETNNYQEYDSFLKNFDVFTRWYSYASGINMQAGNYIP